MFKKIYENIIYFNLFQNLQPILYFQNFKIYKKIFLKICV